MTITLPPEIEGPLSEQARQCGTTPESLAVELLRRAVAPPAIKGSQANQRTLHDRLASYVGVVEGTGKNLSENCGGRFTDYLIEKKQRGRL